MAKESIKIYAKKSRINLIFPILTLQAVTGSHRIGCWGCWTRSLIGDITTGQLSLAQRFFLNHNAIFAVCQANI